jgi:hypothetical protein
MKCAGDIRFWHRTELPSSFSPKAETLHVTATTQNNPAAEGIQDSCEIACRGNVNFIQA